MAKGTIEITITATLDTDDDMPMTEAITTLHNSYTVLSKEVIMIEPAIPGVCHPQLKTIKEAQ